MPAMNLSSGSPVDIDFLLYRFAHSFLYSPRLDSFFLNGGNPGSSSPSAPLLPKQVRLGDFWELKIQRCVGLSGNNGPR